MDVSMAVQGLVSKRGLGNKRGLGSKRGLMSNTIFKWWITTLVSQLF
jgi:hypothetical protein